MFVDDTITAEEATNAAGVGMFQVKLLILSGFVWMARGFETVIVGSVVPLLACTWSLKRWHEVLLSTVTFISTILGCFLYGIWSDKYGRRTAISSSLIFLFVFGAVSAGLPNFTWFSLFRAVTDFSVGGLGQSLVLCCEFFPSKKRGRAIYILSCFWALSVVIMLWIMQTSADNWRVVIALGTLPAFLAMVLMRALLLHELQLVYDVELTNASQAEFFPESFRHLLIQKHSLAANEIVAEMAEANGKKVSGKLSQVADAEKAPRLVVDFFRMPFARSSILLWCMGFITSIAFSGLEVLTPHLLHAGADDVPANISSTDFMGDLQEPILCLKAVPEKEFIFVVWTTALDFPSFIIYMILVDAIDRKILLCASYGLSSLFIFLMFVPSPEIIVYVVFVYCARTLLHGQFDLILLTVAEVLLWHKIMYYLILYGLLTFLCSLACLGLKHETRGRELEDVLKKQSEEVFTANNGDCVEVSRSENGTRTNRLWITR